jgi:hypothetical protein
VGDSPYKDLDKDLGIKWEVSDVIGQAEERGNTE